MTGLYKMFGRSNKHSEYYPMTDLYKMFGRSNKKSEYYPMTDLYKIVRTFKKEIWVLSYDRPV